MGLIATTKRPALRPTTPERWVRAFRSHSFYEEPKFQQPGTLVPGGWACEQHYSMVVGSGPFWAETICVKWYSFTKLCILNQCVSAEPQDVPHGALVMHVRFILVFRFSGFFRKPCFTYRKTEFPSVPEESKMKRTCGHNGPYWNYKKGLHCGQQLLKRHKYSVESPVLNQCPVNLLH
jgi:hypothetical protein